MLLYLSAKEKKSNHGAGKTGDDHVACERVRSRTSSLANHWVAYRTFFEEKWTSAAMDGWIFLIRY